MATKLPLYSGPEWDFEKLTRVHDAIESIAIGELGLDVYRNQIEVITAEQMLDAYAAIGMPLMYRHWSFGKKFAREELLYRKGARALAYELVINSDPCVSYVMEENTMTMQALVISHAAFGHNHFFKNNHLFRQWTKADRVLDDLAYAKAFFAECEQKHGVEAIESLLDSAHALMPQGVSRYAPREKQTTADRRAKARARVEHQEATFNDLWRTVPDRTAEDDEGPPDRPDPKRELDAEPQESFQLPEENLLCFLAEHAPKLRNWQREVLRIISKMAQYFYPQRQTKMMNEGCATFTHYEVMNRLHDRGQIDDAAMMEVLHMHSSVIAQPSFDNRRFSGINPYALGFAMMRDIQRICLEPSAEDRDWFPEIAGNGEPLSTLRDAWSEYRDESFILQFLSPKLIRDLRLFAVSDRAATPFVTVTAIHDEEGYREVRRQLAAQHDLSEQEPELEVTEADLTGNRRLVLTHRVRKKRVLDREDCNRTLRHVASLWGYRVRLVEVDSENGKTLGEYDTIPIP